MPFEVPRNVPEFSNPQRVDEDNFWRARHAGAPAKEEARGGSTIGSKLNQLFSDDRLPMYKDKPNHPPARRKGVWTGPRMLGLVFMLLTFLMFRYFMMGHDLADSLSPGAKRPQSGRPGAKSDWKARRNAVKEAFVTSWDGYEKYAWGLDQYMPISKRGKNMSPTGLGWIIVDALDTAMLMNLTSRVKHARDWMKTSLHYDADYEVNTFETTIRLLGGLLSAHYLSTTFPQLAPQRDDDPDQPGEDLYLELATDLADRLLGAFESESGVPYASVNLNSSHGRISHLDGGASSTAEASTLQLEFKYLSKLTGEPMYWQTAEKVLSVIEGNQRLDGLVPIYIYPSTGDFRGQNIRLGSRGDSYYEYLIKQYLQTSGAEEIYLSMWEEALEGIKKHLVTYSKNSGLTVLAERRSGLRGPLSPKMDHLVCFLPGTVALAATGGLSVADAQAVLGAAWTGKHEENIRLAQELTKTCWAMYKATHTGLAPEIVHFTLDEPPRMWLDWQQADNFDLELDRSADAEWRMDIDIHEQDRHNLQRPETVESFYYMWKITGDEIYREWGWEMFESFLEHTAVRDAHGKVYGYSCLGNVNQGAPTGGRRRLRDNMEGFWMAETLKYFWLLFGGLEEMGLDSGLALDKVVISTEAHFFPRFEMGRVWKTGWERSHPLFKTAKTSAPPEHEHEHDDGYEHGHIEESGQKKVSAE